MSWLEGTKDVRMRKVRQGDFLTGLDNAYVVEVERERVYGNVTLTMHDANGNEVKLIADEDMPVTVRLPREPFAGL